MLKNNELRDITHTELGTPRLLPQKFRVPLGVREEPEC